ncbi:MAG: polymerase [Abditibacteriota bacterium]|nr:polymerase [Abditibacteriota bacterium]
MKLLLIDGYSLLYRAFFSSPPLTTKEGQPTGALYGFSKMVLRLLDEAQPEYALVAMDAAGPTFRHDNYADYKAGRQEMPSDMRSQTLIVRDMLDGLSIPHYEHVGFEADDILGTLSRIASEKGITVTIVTGDGDALQLVDDKVSAMLTRRGVSDLECYTPEAVQARFGFGPTLIPDYKGLRGDASDNIPGVPGIGEKTAMSLMSKWGGLEGIYEHLEEVTPPRIRELLRTHRDVAFESRDLARIVRDLPLDIEFEACRYELTPEKKQGALETVKRFEFKSLYARYSAGGETPAPEDAAPDEEVRAFAVTKAESGSEAVEWLQKNCAKKEAVAFLLDEQAGLALACGDEALLFSGELAEIGDWMTDADVPKIVHDAKTVKLELARRNLSLQGIVADTLLMGYLLDPTRQQHAPSLLATKYLNRTLPVELEAQKKKASKKTAVATSLFDESDGAQSTLSEEEIAAREQHQSVVAATVTALCDLRPVLRRELETIGADVLFDTMELPLVDVLVQMEQCGMLLDVAKLREIGTRLESEARRLQAEIWELAGEEFNIGSTKQLQAILYEKLQLARGRAIKTGFSTDVHTLEKLAEEHEVVRKILEYRGITKLQSTYVDALLNGMDKESHRIHTNLNQTGTVSGRLSSSSPNLQNVPIRTPQGRLIRQAFIAPPGHVILAADYSQIELRILAHITGDKTLVDAFNNGEDVHSRTAADLFGIPVDEVDSEMRRKAKMTNYAIAYGVSGFGLAKQLGSGTAGEAGEFIKKYFETLPGVKKYIDDTMASARVEGHVQTLMGRRRPLPDIHSPRAVERAAAERTAINHPIQGTSADAMKLAMLAVQQELKARKLRSRMTMQVHDELVFEVPADEVREMAEMVGRVMREVPTNALKLRVPLDVDVEVGPNWDQTQDVAELT